jgi:nucleotide-binding universal stress UspA family protein
MKLIFATDGSEDADFAIEFLKRYPAKGAHVICCSAYSPVKTLTTTAYPFMGPTLAENIATILEQEKQNAETFSKEAAQKLQDVGYTTEYKVLEGETTSEIKRLAEQESADMTVVGSRGKSTLEAVLLGSVSRSLANDSHLTLLVTRPKPFALTQGVKAAFLTDHSEFANRVRDYIPKLVNEKFESLEVITVMDPASRDIVDAAAETGRTFDTLEDLDAFIQQWIENRVRTDAEKLKPIAKEVSWSVPYGETREQLRLQCEKANYDLVILGAHGRSAIQRMILGSVSHYMITRAPCSVLIVRA